MDTRQLFAAGGLLLYFFIILFVVLRSKESKNSEEFFLAGRKLPFWALSITFIASWWGGGSAIDLIDHGHNQGIRSFWIYGMPVLFSTFLMFLFAKGIRKVGTITQPQLIAQRYNGRVAFMASILILIFMTVGAAIQVIVIGKFFQTFFTISYSNAAIIGTTIVLLYSFFGGFKGVVITDLVQFVFLFIAAVLMFVYAYINSGGFANVAQIAANRQMNGFFTFTHNWSNNIVYIITFGSSWMIQANIWQRISATRKPSDAKKMMALSFLVFIPLYLMVTLTGMLSIAIFPDVPTGGVAPALIQQFMPTSVAILLFVGICSAIMSTMDSLINTGALVLTVDLYKKQINANASPKQMVWVGKISTFIVSVVALFVGLMIQSIIKISWIGADFLATGVFVPLIMGFLWKRGNSKGAFWSIIFGLVFSTYNLLVAFGINLPVGWEIASVNQALTGMIGSFIVYVCVSLITEPEYCKAETFIAKAGVIK